MISIKLAQEHTVAAAELGEALAHSKPDDIARFFRAFFDGFNRDKVRKQEAAAACVQYAVPSMFDEFNKMVLIAEWENSSREKS